MRNSLLMCSRIILLVISLLTIERVNAQTSTTSGSGSPNWSTSSWTNASGGSSPVVDGGTYAESVFVNGLGNGDVMYIDISVTITQLTVSASGSDPTLRVKAGKTLHITGDLINSNNNVIFYVEAGAFLIVDGTINGNNNNLFGGTGTISGGTLDLGNGSGCLSGSCPIISFNTCSSGNSFCTTNNASNNWQGTTSTNWATASNWGNGAVPTVTSNVVLNSGVVRMPTISSAAAVCNDLTINTGATLTVNGNTLAVGGNLIINSGGTLVMSSDVSVTGTITINSGGILTINGGALTASSSITNNSTGLITITSPGTISAKTTIVNNGTISGTGTTTLDGAVAQTISGTGSYSNLTLNNTSGCTVSSAVTLAGNLTLTLGQLTSNGNLTIDLTTGSISGLGTGSISGNITLLKTANSGQYHYLSAPLSGLTLTDWNDNVPMRFGNYQNIYSYDETNTSPINTDGWTALSSLGTSLTPLKGYALYFNGSTTIDVTGLYAHTTTPSNVILTNTVSADPTSDGFNLVGNPYPSTLDWDAVSGWTKTNIGNAIYFWDPVNSRYATYISGIGANGGTKYIPAMQGFWVRVSVAGGTGTLGVNNSVRTTSSTPSLWRVASMGNILKLTASSDIYSDETVIRFRDDAANNFDNEVDAFKLMNEDNTPSFYTQLENDQYSINSLADTTTDITVPLHLKAGFSGPYTISAEEVDAFDNSYSITLKDRLLDVEQDLRSAPTYICQVNPADTSGRFLISFRKTAIAGINNSSAQSSVNIRAVEHTVIFDFNNNSSDNASIGIYNLLGRQVANAKNADISSSQYSIELPGETGLYVVKIEINGEAFTQKVFLK